MKLKRLEIYGFKSFAEKTEIQFNEGITGIVGPNGSGKSNIGDAVRWVLGEQNARVLRGSRMEDVIFGGTALRKKSNYCEVSLVFDNEDHALRTEYAEVMVTRRVYRNGDSEYYINKNTCRLKDVLELFRDTGIGRDGYSLIGQGRIDDILSAKSEDRRAVFEEAAGVMTYRYRKEEAERKLVRTADNLDRVNDIIGELETRIEPLSHQADTARVYLEISGRLKTLEIHIFVLRYDKTKARLDAVMKTMEGLKEALEQDEKAIAANLALRESLSESMKAIEQELTVLREKQQAAQDRLYRTREELQAQVIRGENMSKALHETSERIEALKEKHERDLILFEETGEKSKRQQEAINAAEHRLSIENAALDQAITAAEECEKELDRHKTAILDAVNRLGDVRTQKTRQQAMHTQMEQRLEEIVTLLQDARDQEPALSEQLKEMTEKEAAARKNLDDLNVSCRRDGEALNALAEHVQHLFDERQQVRLKLETDRSRLRVFLDMSREMDGYSQAVKKALQFGQNDPGVHDVLARLIRVPKEYETAIDMVLGGTLQNIVTDDENAAKRMIDYLRSNKLGRATFLPVSTVRSRLLSADERRLLSMPGCIGVASELIGFDPLYRGIVENLLGRTVIARDLKCGIEIMRAGRHAFRLVTLAGDVMHSGGSMTGGAALKTANLLGRERQIEELTALVEEEEHKWKSLGIEADKQQQILRDRRQSFDLLTEQVHQEEIGLIREQEHLTKAKEALNANIAEQQRLQDAVDQLRDALHTIEEDLRRVSDINETVEVDREKMDEETVRLQDALYEARQRVEAQRTEVQKALSELTDLRHALDMVSRDARQKDEALKALVSQISDTEASYKADQAAYEELMNRLAALQKAVDAAQTAADEALTLAETKEKQRKEQYQRQQEVFREGDALRQTYDQDTQKYHRQELSYSKAENDLNNLCDHMYNTYEITYAVARDLISGDENAFDLSGGEKEAADLRARIRDMGPVNVNAIEEYASVKERFDQLSVQREDLLKAEDDLKDLISRLLRQMEGQFVREFDKLNGFFAVTFNRLFGGGQAELRLSDPSDPLNCGIEIIAQPPGKKLQMLSLLSGGERALTAIAILFAMLNLKPTPFCILDEIEAALDEANIGYFADYLVEYKASTQFVVITHRKGTMERCDALYGVAMREQGVSGMVSVDLRDYE